MGSNLNPYFESFPIDHKFYHLFHAIKGKVEKMAKVTSVINCILCFLIVALTIQLVTAAEYKTGLGVDPNEGYAPLTVTFFDGGSFTIDMGGVYPVEWEWDLDDGTIVREERFVHTYYQPGIYYPKAEVLWSNGHYTTGTSNVVTVRSPITQVTTQPTTYPITMPPTPYSEPGGYDSPADYNPDLTVSELWVMPDSVDAGRTITVTGRIVNLGGRDVNQVTVGYYLSTDAEFDRGDRKLGDYSIAAPIGHETYDRQILLIPEDTYSGRYFLLKVIDPDNRIVERNRSNNVEARPLEVAGKEQQVIYPPVEIETPVITQQVTPVFTPVSVQPTYTEPPYPEPDTIQQITSQPTPFPPPPTLPVTPLLTPAWTPAVPPDIFPNEGFSITVSPVDTSAYAGRGLDYNLTIAAAPAFQRPIQLSLEIDALVTSFRFDLGRVNPPYPQSISRTVPVPSYLPGGIRVTGHIVGESDGTRVATDVYLTILGTDVSLPDSIMLSGAAAVLIALGSLVGLSAAGLSSSLAGIQAAQPALKPDARVSDRRSLYAGRVTGIVWHKERNYVWTGMPDSAEKVSENRDVGEEAPLNRCSCGHLLSETSTFCGNCGKPVQKESVMENICPKCGYAVSPDTVYCGNCGEKI